MPLKHRRFTAPETMPPRPKQKVAEVLPTLVCDAEFTRLVTTFPNKGSRWELDVLRGLWVRPLHDKHWIVNTYPMFIRTMFSYVQQRRFYVGPTFCVIQGLTVSARVTQQPEFPLFVRIEANDRQERLQRVAEFVQLLARDRWTPHVEYQDEQAGYS
jgi:hypothetical protein